MPTGPSSWSRPIVWALIGMVLIAFLLSSLLGGGKSNQIQYIPDFLDRVNAGQVKSIDVYSDHTTRITGQTTDGKSFTTTGPNPLPDKDLDLLKQKTVKVAFHSPSSNILGQALIWILPFLLLIGLWVWMSRRAQGQITGLMSIGRSRAKTYSTEKPKTTFNDVAGYSGVKQEITEVVDFLKQPGKFRDIGARIPKGVLLVGPPGTGKTLIARAVAGEAGVPFMSITGSDFMEMFVGVGAARVRDLFQTARKQAPCIIFVDELDSIGRKRGAGLGGGHEVHMADFESARDRVLMGQRRDSMALSDEEKEIIAHHEGGHAVLAYLLEHADPVHKVTILPTGMALGVTQQLPLEERHIYQRPYIEDSLVVRLGGRIAEELVYGTISTGANNDLVGCTELARKMVREWGMSTRVGPMAWGSQGMVFLGEDLMHTRDYSDETARVIDEEVEHILREQEDRARTALKRHRGGLDAVAHALLEKETVEGAEVGRLVDEAAGRPTPLRPRAPVAAPSGPQEKVQAQEQRSGTHPSDDRTRELPDSPRPAWRER